MHYYFFRLTYLAIMLLLLAGLSSPRVFGQGTPSFDREKWQKLSRSMDYQDGRVEKKEEEQTQSPQNGQRGESPYQDPAILGPVLNSILKIVAVLLLLVILFFLIRSILKANSGAKNKKLKKKRYDPVSMEEIEENLLEADLVDFLEKAKAEGRYLWAIRLYYLQILKALSQRKFIYWKKEKTNLEYLKELGPHPLAPEFQKVTLDFDRLWYGMATLDKEEFERIEPAFQYFLKRVESEKVQTPQLA